MFQRGALFSNLTVQENVAAPMFEHTKLPRSYIPDERMFLETTWNDYTDDRMCDLCARVDDINIVVAGGPEAYHICYIPSFGHTALSTAEIILP